MPCRFAGSASGIQTSAPIVVVVVYAPIPPPFPTIFVKEVALVAEVSASATSVIVAPPSTVATPLLSVGVMTTSAPKMLPLPSSVPLVPLLAILVSALPSSSSHPRVSLYYIYTSCDAEFL